MVGIIDGHGRNISYLRVSVTDRCNFRCSYCMPNGHVSWFPKDEVLSYEEILQIIRVAVNAGISKVRLTGGEPLVRQGIIQFVADIKKIAGVRDLSMTTNGSLLSEFAMPLKRAGLDRVNISLDTLRKDRFSQISGRNMFGEVIKGIESAKQVGFEPIKLNMVVMNGINTDELIDFARISIDKPFEVRFIEYMPVHSRGRDLLFPTSRIKEIINAAGWGKLVEQPSGDGPATIFRFSKGRGSIGFISAITDHFCNHCNRIRLTADGRLKLCLLSNAEVDIKGMLRVGVSEADLEKLLRRSVWQKPAQHDLNEVQSCRRGMSQTGG
ncbi:cyclic pyranopterin phosphate synthase MoaA [Anaerosporomusa subterranea]|uniref:GTP 3',8-cyclase n=1 Tax=Anaerosporomusa subterranea TaxID=1794912 RepID=A0A154BUC6_ANASB|nr:GTP 3',8-cyclase MoaA [Anaerosporomusa subterranea]KYZ77400.1 cyclic pyranopterin phosphate synthase MoaA [Anaerosporomusa subterranea]